MRLTGIFPLTAFIAFSFYSCERCGKIGCLTDNYYVQFRILKAGDSTDLVFGSNRVYDKTKIRFYSVKGADTIFLTSSPVESRHGTFDSILQVYCYPQAETIYMQLSDADVDTLHLTYATYASDVCCPAETEVTHIRFNSGEDFFYFRGIQVFMK